MKLKNIQIVSFNNPYPPNYGGVIDVFYKIKYLHRLNVEIFLHIFYDDRLDIENLKPFCKDIYLYKSDKSYKKFLTKIPFCVSSRSSNQIYNNLIKNDAPILFEGLQSTHVLINKVFKNKIIIRTHNIEHNYYYGLAKSESNILLKLMYFLEGIKLKKYESILNKANLILPLSKSEFDYFNSNYNEKAHFLPVFHGNDKVDNLSMRGEFALYHGDLTTSDNKKAVRFLISVFKKAEHQLIIASSNIPKSLLTIIGKHDNILFIKLEKDNSLLNELFAKAHINILYSNQQSGTKLKVFNSLFKGRFCIVNKNIADDKKILSLCEIAETKEDFINVVNKVFKMDYLQIQKREAILKDYVPLKLADNLIEIIEQKFI